MDSQHALVYLYAESPLHPGGAEGIGAIDLPVQREGVSGMPTIWGSSLKGALRARATSTWARDDVEAVFGSAPGAPDGTSRGALSVSDALTVALPAPTLHRTFCWITTRRILGRLERMYRASGMAGLPPLPEVHAPEGGAVAPPSDWATRTALGDLPVTVNADEAWSEWADYLGEVAIPNEFEFFTNKLKEDLLLVRDDIMDVMSVRSMEVVPHVALGADKTVAQGPWFEESIPTETVLVSMLRFDGRLAAEHLSRVEQLLDGQVIVLGGLESTGRGLAWCSVVSDRASS